MLMVELVRTNQMKRKKETVKAEEGGVNTSRPTAVFKASGGRAYTVSVALPGSIIAKYEIIGFL